MKLHQKLGLASGLLLLSAASQAAIVTTSIEAAITDAQAAGATVGAAVLVMIVTIKAFKYIRRAL